MVEEKERAIEVVKQALEHQRKLSANFSQKFQKELNQRLASQKSEYEAAIHRHQNFIDQVILYFIKCVCMCVRAVPIFACSEPINPMKVHFQSQRR